MSGANAKNDSYVISIHIIFKVIVQMYNVKISYHCISGKKEFNDMEPASIHVKSTKHEIMEEKPGSWI
jgi:hypothetical protein